jgi:3-dehydroquinate dehydratase / shikimate dehydrogenase
MICAVINGPTVEAVERQIRDSLPYAQILELRLDLFDHLDLSWLHKLQSKCLLPMIFTLRKMSEGGKFSQSEKERIAMIRKLIPIQPAFFDIEHDTDREFMQELMNHACLLIISAHFFQFLPQEIEKEYLRMKKIPAKFYKIAVKTNSTTETLQFMAWAKEQGENLISVAMGPEGQISRILAPLRECPLTYSIPELHENELGQLSLQFLHDNYRYSHLGKLSRVFGLIGDPITQSPSHVTHNAAFSRLKKDAVYIKMKVNREELANFLLLAKKFPFAGLSVTMPLKESILPYLDYIEQEAQIIGAVNTLVMKEGKIFGYNTDGKGALDALEKKKLVSGKKVVIIGAGGSARAIAYETIKRGGMVVVLNRDPQKAKRVAEELGCNGDGLDSMRTHAENYDFLINCTPCAMPIDPDAIREGTVVMDIALNAESEEMGFLRIAKSKKCEVVYGREMFDEQAKGQFSLWFS